MQAHRYGERTSNKKLKAKQCKVSAGHLLANNLCLTYMSFPIVTWRRRRSWLELGRSSWVCGTWNYTAQMHQTKAPVGNGTCRQLLPLGWATVQTALQFPSTFTFQSRSSLRQTGTSRGTAMGDGDERETLGSKKAAWVKQGNSCCRQGLPSIKCSCFSLPTVLWERIEAKAEAAGAGVDMKGMAIAFAVLVCAAAVQGIGFLSLLCLYVHSLCYLSNVFYLKYTVNLMSHNWSSSNGGKCWKSLYEKIILTMDRFLNFLTIT